MSDTKAGQWTEVMVLKGSTCTIRIEGREGGEEGGRKGGKAGGRKEGGEKEGENWTHCDVYMVVPMRYLHHS